jgi:hypothetical protein
LKTTYEIEVRAQCPVNPSDTDLYSFQITSQSIIEEESIVRFFAEHAGHRTVFQETLTQQCAVALGAHVRSVGTHSGVLVTCCAP